MNRNYDSTDIYTGTILNINPKYKDMYTSIIADNPGNTFLNSGENTCLTNIKIYSNYNITSGVWKNSGTDIKPDGSQSHIGVYGEKSSL